MSDEKRNPEGRENVYTNREIPSLILLDIKYEELLSRVRVLEDVSLKIQSTSYRIDEDYQIIKHKKEIASRCCPFFCKEKKCENQTIFTTGNTKGKL